MSSAAPTRSRQSRSCILACAAAAVAMTIQASPADARGPGGMGGLAMSRGHAPVAMGQFGRRAPVTFDPIKTPPRVTTPRVTLPRLGAHVTDPKRPGGETRPRPPRRPKPPIVVIPPILPPGGPPGIVSLPPTGGGPPPSIGPSAPASPAIAQPATDNRFVPDEVLVSFRADLPPQTVIGIAQRQRLALLGVHRLPSINLALYRFRITDRRAVPAVIASLRADGRIATVQPNFLYTLLGTETRAGDAGQYALGKLRVRQAHAVATGQRVLVAVIDSAIDLRHPEFAGSIAAAVDTVRGPAVPHPHGTAMASAIAAHSRLLGVAPAARILAIRAFDPATAGAQSTTTRILDGLQSAANSDARVVNMSFSGPADPKMRDMIAALRRKGAVLIAAAGNDGPRASAAFPAAYPDVIAVTATDVDDRRFANANRGAYVAVAAPGVDIMVAAPNGGYTVTTGTSIAAAHVSGVAALLLDRNPGLNPDAIRAILARTARDLGAPGRDDDFGSGLVDALEAVTALAPPTLAIGR